MNLRRLQPSVDGPSSPLPGEGGTSASISRFPAFASRNYRLFFSGQLVSVTGTWMQSLAQSYLVYELLHASPFQLGLVNVLQFAPVLLIGIPAGVLADRLPKRNLLVATQCVFAVLAAVFAYLVAGDHIQLWQVYLLSTLFGITNAVDMPVRQSFVPEIVDRPALLNAIALNSTVFNTGRVLGPALAGVVLATAGPAFCFSLNAISYLAVIAGLLRMQIPHRVRAHSGSGVGRLRDGMAYVRGSDVISRTILIVGAVSIFGLNFSIWVPILASDSFASGAGTYGLLFSSLGIGSLLGAFSLAVIGRSPNRTIMLSFACALGVAEIVLGMTSSTGAPVIAGMALLLCTGFCSSMVMALANSTVQAAAPDEFRGRVMAVYTTVFAGTAPIGFLFSGAISDKAGVSFSLGLNGVLLTLVIAAIMFGQRAMASNPVPSPTPGDT